MASTETHTTLKRARLCQGIQTIGASTTGTTTLCSAKRWNNQRYSNQHTNNQRWNNQRTNNVRTNVRSEVDLLILSRETSTGLCRLNILTLINIAPTCIIATTSADREAPSIEAADIERFI